LVAVNFEVVPSLFSVAKEKKVKETSADSAQTHSGFIRRVQVSQFDHI
jgi:hypothetical protein